MKYITIGAVSLEVDVDATKELYPCAGVNCWCQCAGCTNFRAACREFYPQSIYGFLRSLGIDPTEPHYLTMVQGGKVTPRMRRYAGHFAVVGKITRNGRSRQFYQNRSFIWMSVDPTGYHGGQPRREEIEEAHFYLNFSMLVPWLPEFITSLVGDPNDE